MNSSTTLSRPTLAVAMIVKNEAKVIEQCLESIAQLADEIVILDAAAPMRPKQLPVAIPINFMLIATGRALDDKDK